MAQDPTRTGSRRRARDGRPSPIVLGLAFALPLLIALAIAGYNTLTRPSCVRLDASTRGAKSFAAPPCMTIDTDSLYYADFETTAGPIRIALDPILAPVSVNNIVFLARAGFYDDTPVAKVENTSDYAYVQFGDPGGTARGTAGYTYQGEAPSPITRYLRGVVAMANTGTLDTNSSQFFIIGRDYEDLSYPARQPNNTVVGRLLDAESIDTLDTILALPIVNGKPIEDIRITGVTITEQKRFGEASPSPSASASPTPS